jgi:hypothetical protein
MRKSLAFVAIALSPAVAVAQTNNIGTCGWGSKLFDGQSGIAPQVLAVTTNGTSGNQTFGITSGTSGCTQNGTVKSTWKTAMFIDSNMNKVAHDMSVGNGESLESLATLLGVPSNERSDFYALLQSNFERIYSHSEVTSREVVAGLTSVLKESRFSAYANM